jgi:hypothetical protein
MLPSSFFNIINPQKAHESSSIIFHWNNTQVQIYFQTTPSSLVLHHTPLQERASHFNSKLQTYRMSENISNPPLILLLHKVKQGPYWSHENRVLILIPSLKSHRWSGGLTWTTYPINFTPLVRDGKSTIDNYWLLGCLWH